MNKKKFLAGSLVALGFLPVFAFAEDGASVSASTSVNVKVEARKQEREQEREKQEGERNTIKQNIEAKKEALQESVKARKEVVEKQVLERLQKFVDTIVVRFESATERLGTLSARIQSRIDKLTEAGIDAKESQKALDEAKAKIQLAKEAVAKIKPKADEVIAGDARALYPELKEVVNNAKEAIKEAHASLVEVVKELKPGQQKLEAKVESRTKVDATASTTEDDNS